MIKDIIIINNFYGFCSFLLYNHTLNNINSISLLLFWCEIVCYKTQIIVYFFWGTVRMPLFVREIWRHSHYISPNFGCVLLIVLRFFGWSPNLILLSIRYILYPLALYELLIGNNTYNCIRVPAPRIFERMEEKFT